MLCRRCGRSESDNGATPARVPRLTQPRVALGRIGQPERRRQSRCSICGSTLDAPSLTERVLEKQSLLARFGLADREEPLLKGPDPKEE
jgi:hypothetical protein